MLGWPSWSKAVDLSSSLFGGVGSNPTSSNIYYNNSFYLSHLVISNDKKNMKVSYFGGD